MGQFDLITEWTSDTNTKDLPIYIYELPVRDMDQNHQENGKVAYQLYKLNNTEVVFYERWIASIKELTSWGDYKYLKKEFRCIDPDNNKDKKLLERLILRCLANKDNKNRYFIKKGLFRENKAEKTIGNIDIFYAIEIDVNIGKKGEIIIGFDSTHRFAIKGDLVESIQKGTIQRGDVLTHKYLGISYKFCEKANHSISDKSPLLGTSIIDYYKGKKNEAWIKNINPKLPAVIVEGNNGLLMPFSPTLLRKVCSFESIPKKYQWSVNKAIKLGPHEKTNKMLEHIREIMKNCKYINFNTPQNMFAKNQSYKVFQLNMPTLEFGKQQTSTYPKRGLQNGGVYEKKDIEISYFIDPDIMQWINQKTKEGEKAKVFADELERLSEKLGINIKRIKKHKELDYETLDFSNEINALMSIKKIAKILNHTTVMVMTEERIDKYYGAFKKEFGNKNDIPTQFVSLKKIDIKEGTMDDTMLNILLGIYAKSGIQPWILHKPLHSDCFIGLDVSHEDKRHAAGIVQVVGRRGENLLCKSIAAVEAGEKIRPETLREVFMEACHSYEEIYGHYPKHITFHRDGFCREDVDYLKELASEFKITFDYVEVRKNIKRRMATYQNKQWHTIQGMSYIKEDTAYLCSTNPRESIGMAKPIKIVHRYGEKDIEALIEDIYALSFMHIGSLIKTRLPVTTHYADLSSTFSNRGWMPSNGEGKALHFV